MVIVARKVHLIGQTKNHNKSVKEQLLSDYRLTPAWILLGEPGAGKTEALKMEALATQGLYLTASELIAANPPPIHWLGKTLFIDSLDESRAAGTESLILRIGNQLRNLSCPSFRLACRAADWYGADDRADIEEFSPDGQLTALQLLPLESNEIQVILQDNHGVADPVGFAEQANRHDISSLLHNPQTLGMMANAIRNGNWPKNRSDVYQLACKGLANEDNRRHRNTQRTAQIDLSQILSAAGQILTVLLLTGKRGIALDPDVSNADFPTLKQLFPDDLAAANKALQSKLFLPATNHDEHLIPCHRSVAEYLAANWLGERLDRNELPLRRLLEILLGRDGGVVADLRGLFAWLAQLSTLARRVLIDADPLAVVLYGDARPLSTADKRQILRSLHRQAERFPGFRWHIQHNQEAFGTLADEALTSDFREILVDPRRDDKTQSLIDCVVDILEYGAAIPALAENLLAVIKDSTLWLRIRQSALRAWFLISPGAAQKNLLMQIISNIVEDDDDELMGYLLEKLYPEQIKPKELLQYLRREKNTKLVGSYRMFWEYWLLKLTPDTYLPDLLNCLAQQTEIFDQAQSDEGIYKATSLLVAHAINTLGDEASNEQLTVWLGVGTNKHGATNRAQESQTTISKWFETRPERYKSVLHLAIQSAERFSRINIPYIAPSIDLGLWHLKQASKSADRPAKIHLTEAFQAFALHNEHHGKSLEALTEWAELNPTRAGWLEELLVCHVEEWRILDAAQSNNLRDRRQRERGERTLSIAPHIPTIETGMARPYILEELARVWLKHFNNIFGNTASERFSNYSNHGDNLRISAETGFKKSIYRDDLPSAEDIISASFKNSYYRISKPCQLGIKLLHLENPKQAAQLPDHITEKLLAFHLTDTYGDLADWPQEVARQKPELFANILVRHTNCAFSHGDSPLNLYRLFKKSDDYREVAKIASPNILLSFPTRVKKDQIDNLKHLLTVALVVAPGQLVELTNLRILKKGLDGLQKTLWLVIAILFDPVKYGSLLQKHMRKNLSYAFLALEYITNNIDGKIFTPPISTHILGNLIEISGPHAEMDRTNDADAQALERGHQIRTLIGRLENSLTSETELELQRLLKIPNLANLKYAIQSTANQLRNKRREIEFTFRTTETVANILSNKAPTDINDLTALTLSHLEEIEVELRHSNDDGYRAFWNVVQGKAISQREENLCRDALLQRLRPRLNAQGVSISPEVDHASDRRADLQLDYRNKLILPIEIKRDSNLKLWTAMHQQLMKHYTNEPKTFGYGIYLIFWFGDPTKPLPKAPDSATKPTTAQELQSRLRTQLSVEEQQRIFIKVIDVSWR